MSESQEEWNRRRDDDRNRKIDDEMKTCNEIRVRLEEHDKVQQKEIDHTKSEVSELYDYKNDIYRKITENKANAATVKDHNELAKQVTQLKTEKKFLPYVVMIISLIGTIISGVYITNKLTRGKYVGKQCSQIEVNERLPVLRSQLSEDNE